MAKRKKKAAATGDRCRFGRSTRGPTKGRCRKSAPKKAAKAAKPRAKAARRGKLHRIHGKKVNVARRSALRTVDMRAGTARQSGPRYGKVALPYHPAALNRDWNG